MITTKSQQLKAASKRYANCLFGNFERALLDDRNRSSFKLVWTTYCPPDLLATEDRTKMKGYIEKAVRRRLKQFRHYSTRYELNNITVDIIDSELYINGRIDIHEN